MRDRVCKSPTDTSPSNCSSRSRQKSNYHPLLLASFTLIVRWRWRTEKRVKETRIAIKCHKDTPSMTTTNHLQMTKNTNCGKWRREKGFFAGRKVFRIRFCDDNGIVLSNIFFVLFTFQRLQGKWNAIVWQIWLPEIRQSGIIYSHYGNNHKKKVVLPKIDVSDTYVRSYVMWETMLHNDPREKKRMDERHRQIEREW